MKNYIDSDHKNDYLAITFRFERNKVTILDQNTSRIIRTIPFYAEITTVHTLGRGYHIIFSDNSCKIMAIRPFGFRCGAQTKGEYILRLQMESENTGYYFGLYELGKFELLDNEQLKITGSYSVHYLDNGWILKNKKIILSLRKQMTRTYDEKKYSIGAYSWNSHSPQKLWEIDPTYSLNALIELDNDQVLFGFLNGEIAIFLQEQMKIVKTVKVFSGTVSFMCSEGKSVYCSSSKGEVACITHDLATQWKISLDDSAINTIHFKDDKLVIFTAQKKLFIVDPDTGVILQEKNLSIKSPRTFSSNFIICKDWMIMSGDAHLVHIPPSGYIFTIYSEDPLIRVLKPHPFGYFTGDDEGKIKFWSYLQIYSPKSFREIQ